MIRRTFIATLVSLLPLGAALAQPARPPRSIRELNSGEVQSLDKADAVGRQVLQYYAQTAIVDPKALDAAFRNWKADRSIRRAPERVVAEGLGAVFGNYVVERKVASWVVVTDSFGTDIAVRSPKGGELYPISSVWKRVDPKDDDDAFFEPIWTLIAKEKFDDR